MVDREMIATSTAIEEAVLRMDVRTERNVKISWTALEYLTFLFAFLLHRRSWTRQGETLLVWSWRSTRGTVKPVELFCLYLVSLHPLMSDCFFFVFPLSILGSCSDLMKVRHQFLVSNHFLRTYDSYSASCSFLLLCSLSSPGCSYAGDGFHWFTERHSGRRQGKFQTFSPVLWKDKAFFREK